MAYPGFPGWGINLLFFSTRWAKRRLRRLCRSRVSLSHPRGRGVSVQGWGTLSRRPTIRLRAGCATHPTGIQFLFGIVSCQNCMKMKKRLGARGIYYYVDWTQPLVLRGTRDSRLERFFHQLSGLVSGSSSCGFPHGYTVGEIQGGDCGTGMVGS